jgi:hypothetical protein
MHVALYVAASPLNVLNVVVIVVIVVVFAVPSSCPGRHTRWRNLRSRRPTPTLSITPEHPQEAAGPSDTPFMPKQRAINEQTDTITP